MNIFEYPYAIVGIFALSFILLISIGVALAVKGIRMADGDVKNAFCSISKVESNFKKTGKSRVDRCMFYISISSDDLHDLYSQRKVLAEINQVLLATFSQGGDSVISFVAFSKWDEETLAENKEHVVEEINKCLIKHGVLNVLKVRIGAYLVAGTQVDFDEAISRARQACMLAQNENVPYAKWNVSSGKALEKKIKIENNIEKEIDNNRFFLEYQPVLDAKTKQIIGAEVLSRLNSESEGVLAPGSFLPAVESVGLNGKFDYYIFEKNCKWISNDKEQREGYKYTINFSRATLSDPSFVERIINIAEKYDLKFSCLAIEILEDKSVTGEAHKQMVDNLEKLKDRGVSILLDDFGSGYTTFGDMQNLNISIVKIDKAITQNSVTETGFIILKNIIRTSQDIGYKTLCEGIETKEQEEAVIRAGCDLLQGFYYYKPMPVSMLESLFDKKTGGN